MEVTDIKGIVLVAHGLNANRENFLYPVGYRAIIFDFPAHRDCLGRSVTLFLAESQDVHAAALWLQSLFPNQPIHELGYSIGAEALLTAVDREPTLLDKIIIGSTFANIRGAAESSVLRFFAH